MITFRLAPLGLLAAALGDAAISLVLVARYPAVTHLDGSGPLLVALVIGAVRGGWRCGDRAGGPRAAAACCRPARQPVGVVFGGLWVLEMTVANEWYGRGSWRLVPYFGFIVGVWVFNVLAGALAAYRYRRIAAGSLVGLWAGLVSGLVGLATTQLQVLLTLPVLRADPQNIAEAVRAHTALTTHIVDDQVVAGISHLVLVGMIVGTALGTLGAVVGRAIPRTDIAAMPA